MNIQQALIASTFAGATLLFAGQAIAQFYIGGSGGRAEIDREITRGLITSGTVDSKDRAFKLFGGYQFHQNFAVEGAYVDLGTARYSGELRGAPVTDGEVKVRGVNLSAVGSLRVLAPWFSVFGKVGLFGWEAKVRDVTAGIGVHTDKSRGSDVSYGIGAAIALTADLAVRAEWERLRAEGASIDLASVGLVYRF